MDTNPDHLEVQGVEHMYNQLSSPEVRNFVEFVFFHLIVRSIFKVNCHALIPDLGKCFGSCVGLDADLLC